MDYQSNDAAFEYEDILRGDVLADGQIDEILQGFTPSDEPPRARFSADADPAQKAFIESRALTIRLLAPAGSGKTQSIANRVAKCVSDGMRPDRILLLTFDNAARVTLAERIASLLTAIGCRSTPPVLTLNSFGNGLLRNELRDSVPNLTLGEGLPKHQAMIVGSSIKELRKKRPDIDPLLPRNLAASVYCQIFSLLKNEIITPQSLTTAEGQTRFIELVRSTSAFRPWIDPLVGGPEAQPKTKLVLNSILSLYKRYWSQMRRDHRMDFDDQKLIPFMCLSEHQSLLSMVQARHDSVIVDEFQDINRLDFELIQLIAAKASLVVVGDDDQAIYGFRGCTPRYMIEFESLSGRPTQTFNLETNYRCPANIVDLSQRLIVHNSFRVPKVSRSRELAPTADVELWHSVNSASEAQIIAKSIKRIVANGRGQIAYGDIAVLFRMNSQSLPLQLALILNEVPYFCRKEDNLLLSDTMRRILRLVGLHLQLKSGVAFTNAEDGEAIYESFFRWHTQANCRQFVRLSMEHNSFVRAALALEGRDRRWRGLAAAISALGAERSPIGIIEYIGQTFTNLRGLIGDLEEAIDGHVPLGELLDVARRFKGNTREFYETLHGLAQKAEQGLFAAGEEDGVNLLTYFRAKGRQWHTVFLPGVNQRVIPDRRAPLEDERRLFYVAVTRPTANLVLSYVRQAVRERVAPSQFLAEMGMGEGRERRAATS